MSALVTDNLPLLAGAPNGIKKLRELILELAVRGKLVPQDPNDEPASELLKRIAEEKARLVAEGKIKKQKSLPVIIEEEPFTLPKGWCWVSLNEIATMRGGSTPSMSKPEFWNGEIPWVSPKDMHDGDITDSELKVSQLALEKTSLELVPLGSILVVGRSGILKRKLPTQITAVPCAINQDLKAISPLKPQLSVYVQLMLKGTERVILKEDVKQGTTVQSLVYEKLFTRPFGLPPLAEQYRIVAKVDELMALCDRLDAKQADAESAHAQLVQALLDSLTQAADADDFAQSWQRLAEHFHTLFTTESSIDALKQTLLQLAVMGKLVPQDPNDEPASELLKRIAEEKARLVANGEIKRQKPSPDIEKEEAPFSLPSHWLWARLTDCSKQVTDGEHLTPPRTSDATQIPLVTAKNVRDGYMDYAHTDYVDRTVAEKCWGRCRPEQGDIMVVSVGATLGRLTVIPTTQEMVIVRSVTLIKPLLVLSEFLALALKSPFSQSAIWAGVKQSAQPCLYLSQSSQLLVPLPPLPEQHRIVAKVDQLMALCDQLKQRLSQARTLHEQLANTLVEQAVA